MKKSFTKKLTKKMIKLSNLPYHESDAEYYTKQFNETIKAVDAFNKLATKGIRGIYQVTGLKNVLRKDNIDKKRILKQEEALSNAKKIKDGYFVVKGVFENE